MYPIQGQNRKAMTLEAKTLKAEASRTRTGFLRSLKGP